MNSDVKGVRERSRYECVAAQIAERRGRRQPPRHLPCVFRPYRPPTRARSGSAGSPPIPALARCSVRQPRS